MASKAAQSFFNKQSPEEQQRIRASWGGADLMDEWYQNAAAAGNPDAIRAGGQGQSEDFDRFKGPDFERWAQYYDKAESQRAGRPRYRSSRGAEGFYDKPTECPDGQSPAGPDETSPCKSTQALLAAQGQSGGAAGAGAAGTPGATAPNPNDPLQARLVEMFQGGEGSFAGPRAVGSDLAGGGIWSAGSFAPEGAPGVNPALAQATLTAFSPNAPSVRGPVGGTYTDPYEAAKQGGTVAPVSSAAVSVPQPGTSSTAPGTVPTAPQAPVGAGGDALSAAVQRRFRDPNQWWAGSGNRQY
jgi:hypothetical protein